MGNFMEDIGLANTKGGAGWLTQLATPLLGGLASYYGSKAQAGALRDAANAQSRIAQQNLAYQKERDAIQDKRYEGGQLAQAQQSDAMQKGFLYGFGQQNNQQAQPGLAQTAAYV
jgi:hypothetical protein